MTRRFAQEELNSQVVKFRGENRFHQFAARQCSYHLSVYNLVYRIKVSAALCQTDADGVPYAVVLLHAGAFQAAKKSG